MKWIPVKFTRCFRACVWLAVLLLGSSAGLPASPDGQFEGRLRKTVHIKFIPGETGDKPVLYQEWFDKDGREEGYRQYDAGPGAAKPPGTLSYYEKRFYDESGRLKTVIATTLGQDGKQETTREYHYADKSGDKLQSIDSTSSTGAIQMQDVYTYDDGGKLIEMRILRGKKVQEIRKYTYDQAGRKSVEAIYQPAGSEFSDPKRIQWTTFTYGEDGNLKTKKTIKTQTVGFQSNIPQQVETTYDWFQQNGESLLCREEITQNFPGFPPLPVEARHRVLTYEYR